MLPLSFSNHSLCWFSE
ncbi:hypothetical protein VCHENC02_2103A, partial [Vibrio harveyi]